MISTKHYARHIIEPYFALETNHPDTIDFEQVCFIHFNSRFNLYIFQIEYLKELIEKTALDEPYIGEQIPTRWLEFENDLNRLKKQQDTFYASLDQVCIPSLSLFLHLLILSFRFVK